MYKGVIDFLISNSILAGEQFGFRENLSTENTKFSFTEEILGALSNRMHVGGISCNLTKAFECVNHELLLPTLNLYGIRNSNNNIYSYWGVIKLGVPQA
jgi:hypothetical protein